MLKLSVGIGEALDSDSIKKLKGLMVQIVKGYGLMSEKLDSFDSFSASAYASVISTKW